MAKSTYKLRCNVAIDERDMGQTQSILRNCEEVWEFIMIKFSHNQNNILARQKTKIEIYLNSFEKHIKFATSKLDSRSTYYLSLGNSCDYTVK